MINEPEFLVQEMIQGYMDGRKLDSLEPSNNRTNSYRHGFLAGRNDLGIVNISAAIMRVMANEAIKKDTN